MANALGQLFGGIADAIREKSGETGKMKPIEFPEKIRGIEGGSSADVRYVTFMSHDGSVEYGKLPVANGYDCPELKNCNPTKESGIVYDYTHNGWSKYKDGSATASALQAVTEDRTVYAAFSSTFRIYTATFYDDAGNVMKTEQVPYGSKATPPSTERDGFVFANWEPEDLTIRGDTDFVGVWEEGAVNIMIPYQEITGTKDATYGYYAAKIPYAEIGLPDGYAFTEGDKWFVEFNGVVYEDDVLKSLGQSKSSSSSYTAFTGIGNPYLKASHSTWYHPATASGSNYRGREWYGDYPFMIDCNQYTNFVWIYTESPNETYTIKVYQRLD